MELIKYFKERKRKSLTSQPTHFSGQERMVPMPSVSPFALIFPLPPTRLAALDSLGIK